MKEKELIDKYNNLENKYKNELKKDSPRIPLVKGFKEFSIFGRKLSQIHLNYEKHENSSCKVNINEKGAPKSELYKVEKMRFGKNGDKSTIIFNKYITIQNIPAEAFTYLVNGKSPAEWVMDRYMVKRDADSDILNDPNAYSNDEQYILKLLLSVLQMSIDIQKLYSELPNLELLEGDRE